MGSGIFTSAVVRCVAPHTRFWQQFQNYAPPSLRVIRTKIARTIININIQVKKKAFKINAKIEDVGLNED